LVQHPNTHFAFKRGINVAGIEKGAFFPKQASCSCLLPFPKNLHVPPLNAKEGWPRERQKWPKPCKEESRPLPHNRPAVVTATTTTLSKKKTYLHQLPWVFEEEESYRVMLMTETMRREGVWQTCYTTKMEEKEKLRLRTEPCHQNLL